MKYEVRYDIKDRLNHLTPMIKVFSDFKSACNFVREIRSVSLTLPILEEKKK